MSEAYPGAMAVLRAAEEVPKERRNARAIVRKTTLDQRVESAEEVLADPELPARYQIDLQKQAMLGRLQGLLPNVNLGKIEDATKLGLGVVTAQAMAVQDAVAMNLWVANAAIESAKIAGLVADKIDAGTINVALALVTGGTIEAGGMKMGPGGGELTRTADELSKPREVSASKITNSPDSAAGVPVFGALSFYSIEGTGQADARRGAQLSADGDGTYRRGQARLDGFGGPTSGFLSTRHAYVIAQGGRDATEAETRVLMGPHAFVNGTAVVAGVLRSPTAIRVGPDGGPFAVALESNGEVRATLANIDTVTADTVTAAVRFLAPYRGARVTVGANSSVDLAPGLGKIPDHVQAFVSVGGGLEVPAEYTAAIRISEVTANRVRLQNTTATAYEVRVSAF